MKNVILSMLAVGLLQTIAQCKSYEVSGVVIQYDTYFAGVAADVVLKSENDRYLRLIYAPKMGFDAPPLEPEEAQIRQMFSDKNVYWSFEVRDPENLEETNVCKSDPLRIDKDAKGNLVKGSRYSRVQGKEEEVIPKLKNIPCYFIKKATFARKSEK